MFKNLTDFSYKRNRKEAFGFYFAYVFLAMIIGGVLGALLSTTSDAKTFQEGIDAGLESNVVPVVTILYVTLISVLVFLKRKLHRSFRYIVLIVLNCFFAFLGGAILGLILPAFMTTRDIHSKEGN